MTDTKTSRREVTLPAAALLDLIATARGAGADALRERGRSAGRMLAERLTSPNDAPSTMRALPIDLFWKRVGEVFSSRGWGTLTHGEAGPGLGELRSSDWIEADRQDRTGGCGFTAGVLEGLLQAVAGSPLAIEETECRATGGSTCRFVFGSPAAVRRAGRATTSAATLGV